MKKPAKQTAACAPEHSMTVKFEPGKELADDDSLSVEDSAYYCRMKPSKFREICGIGDGPLGRSGLAKTEYRVRDLNRWLRLLRSIGM